MPPPPSTKGQWWLNGDGTWSLDSTGKFILDDMCAPCCCAPSAYKVVLSGITFPLACSITPWFDAGTCPGANPLASSNNFNCTGTLGELYCPINFTLTGAVNGTYILPKVADPLNPYCTYSLSVPAPLTATLNNIDGLGAFICGTPTGPLTVGPLVIGLAFQGDGFAVTNVLLTAQITILNVPTYGGSPLTQTVILPVFGGTVGSGYNQVCGTLCPLKTVSNDLSIGWYTGGAFVQIFTGGTGVFTPM